RHVFRGGFNFGWAGRHGVHEIVPGTAPDFPARGGCGDEALPEGAVVARTLPGAGSPGAGFEGEEELRALGGDGEDRTEVICVGCGDVVGRARGRVPDP